MRGHRKRCADSGRRRRSTRKERAGDDLPLVRRDTDGVAGRIPRAVSPVHVWPPASGSRHATLHASETTQNCLPRATGCLKRSTVSMTTNLALFHQRFPRAMVAVSRKPRFHSREARSSRRRGSILAGSPLHSQRHRRFSRTMRAVAPLSPAPIPRTAI